MFGVFFNSTNNKIFSDSSVLRAFDIALDRQAIINSILDGYGTSIHSPIPGEILIDGANQKYTDTNLDDARSILDKGGWTLGTDGIRVHGGTKTIIQTKKVGKKTVSQKVTVNNGPITKLVFSLSTGNTPELEQASNLVKEQLEKIGAQVEIKVYETGPFNQILRERKYEALFAGLSINHESDLLSFWHSSQKIDPGRNIALYSNKIVDSILENVQKISNPENRTEKYKDLVKEFNKDIPALLIYSPKYLYATSLKLNHVSMDTLTIPSDRFTSVYIWYAREDHIWKIFNK